MKVARSDLHFFCARVRARARVCVCARMRDFIFRLLLHQVRDLERMKFVFCKNFLD